MIPALFDGLVFAVDVDTAVSDETDFYLLWRPSLISC